MDIGAFEVVTPDPPLREPHCIAMLRPWVNVGNVGAIVMSRLARVFDTMDVGRLRRPSAFYDMTRYRPEMKLVDGERTFTVPNTLIFGARRESAPDLLMLQMLEPHANAEDFNDSVLGLLAAFNVQRYVLVGGMYDAVPHSRPLPVSGAARGWEPPAHFGGVRLGRSNYQGPTSMTSQLAERSRAEMGLETLSLIVRLPLYLKLDDDFAGAARLLNALASIYDLDGPFPEQDLGERQYAQITPAMSSNPQLAELVKRFERDYDAQEAQVAAEDIPLPPGVEEFLEELRRKQEGPGGSGSF